MLNNNSFKPWNSSNVTLSAKVSNRLDNQHCFWRVGGISVSYGPKPLFHQNLSLAAWCSKDFCQGLKLTLSYNTSNRKLTQILRFSHSTKNPSKEISRVRIFPKDMWVKASWWKVMLPHLLGTSMYIRDDKKFIPCWNITEHKCDSVDFVNYNSRNYNGYFIIFQQKLAYVCHC